MVDCEAAGVEAVGGGGHGDAVVDAGEAGGNVRAKAHVVGPV